MIFVNFNNSTHNVIVNLDNNNVKTSCFDVVNILKKDDIINLCFDCLSNIRFVFNNKILDLNKPLFKYGIRAASIPMFESTIYMYCDNDLS